MPTATATKTNVTKHGVRQPQRGMQTASRIQIAVTNSADSRQTQDWVSMKNVCRK